MYRAESSAAVRPSIGVNSARLKRISLFAGGFVTEGPSRTARSRSRDTAAEMDRNRYGKMPSRVPHAPDQPRRRGISTSVPADSEGRLGRSDFLTPRARALEMIDVEGALTRPEECV